MGYTMAAYPLTLLSASIKAMQESLQRIKMGLPTDDIIATFTETKDVVGFTNYAKEEDRYSLDWRMNFEWIESTLCLNPVLEARHCGSHKEEAR